MALLGGSVTSRKHQTPAGGSPFNHFNDVKEIPLITIKSSGSTKNTDLFLDRMKKGSIFESLPQYGQMGVDALAGATPRESGETAQSWTYKIVKKKGFVSIVWLNTHIVDGANIAVLIQYGHGTGNGGYVQGRDYINPVIKPIFDKITAEIWKGVTQ